MQAFNSGLLLTTSEAAELLEVHPCNRAIQPFMEEVGMAWREGRLRIGEEHIASPAVVEALVRLSDRAWHEVPPEVDGRASRPAAVVGSMEENRHHIGAMCVRILLQRTRWTVHYLGAGGAATSDLTSEKDLPSRTFHAFPSTVAFIVWRRSGRSAVAGAVAS